MQNIIKLQVTKSKSKTNYIPSIPLNKKKELSEYPNRIWTYDRKTNQIHLTAITQKPEPTQEQKQARAVLYIFVGD